ncbi:hypothetical protein ACFX19_019727 [Malus domestica]
MSCPHTPEQNRLPERKHRHIIETSITLLRTASLPPSFWSYACQASVYLINRMPSSTLENKSPFKVLFNSIPEINHLRVFGCSCYPLLRPYNHTKLQPRTSKCIFLGYASKYKGYICFEVHKRRVFISCHVLFDETKFPYITLVSQCSKVSTPLPIDFTSTPVFTPNLNNVLVTPQSNSVPTIPSVSHTPSLASVPLSAAVSSTDLHVHSSATVHDSSSSLSTDTPPITGTSQQSSHSLPVVPEFQGEQLQVVLSIPPLNNHPMQTQSKNGISKKIALLASVHENRGTDLT